MKHCKPKLTPNTPEKSDILRMFEKIRSKKEQNMIWDSHNIRIDDAKITPKRDLASQSNVLPDDFARKSPAVTTKKLEYRPFLKDSPKLKPKNRSKFEELRSIFEGGGSDEREDNKVFIRNINVHQDTFQNISCNIGNNSYTSWKNIAVCPAKIVPKSANLNDKKRSENKDYCTEVSWVEIVDSVVRLPYPEKSKSLKLDSKQSKPSSSRKSVGKRNKNENLSSQQLISRFLEKKTEENWWKLWIQRAEKSIKKLQDRKLLGWMSWLKFLVS